MATYLDGNVRKATPNTVKAMQGSAAARKCPACGRKSALSREEFPDSSVTYCRWRDKGCRFERYFDHYTRETIISGMPSPP